MRSVSLVQTQDRNINQLQQNILQALRPLLTSPLLNGYIIEGIVLAVGDNTIFHGLDRELQGWFTVTRNAATALYDKQSTNASPDTTLILNSSAVATIDLYVF